MLGISGIQNSCHQGGFSSVKKKNKQIYNVDESINSACGKQGKLLHKLRRRSCYCSQVRARLKRSSEASTHDFHTQKRKEERLRVQHEQNERAKPWIYVENTIYFKLARA